MLFKETDVFDRMIRVLMDFKYKFRQCLNTDKKNISDLYLSIYRNLISYSHNVEDQDIIKYSISIVLEELKESRKNRSEEIYNGYSFSSNDLASKNDSERDGMSPL